MTEQQLPASEPLAELAPTRNARLSARAARYTMPHVVSRSNWVAIAWSEYGPWFVVRRGHEAEAPTERFTLPQGDSASSF